MATSTKKMSAALSVKRSSKQLTIKQLVEEYMYRIDTDADYQREKVWSKSDQELLLDSIVHDIDIPKIYLAKVGNDKKFEFECIDGKQRLLTISNFYNPDKSEAAPLRIEILNKQFTYSQLKEQHPNIAKSIDEYTLDFVIYDEANLTDSFIREIFKRLQLGIRLNSGEILNSQLGAIRDFVFKEIGKDGPFLRHTKLSDKRYSRQFTLAQICLNSFHRQNEDEFVRARLADLQDFFDENSKLGKQDENLVRIRKVLNIMDKEFGDEAKSISSRAIAVSAYLFVEGLVKSRKTSLIPRFVKFYIGLLDTIAQDMELISQYEKPKDQELLEQFQKYVLQASVEPYSIKRRDDYLKAAFGRYISKRAKGKTADG